MSTKPLLRTLALLISLCLALTSCQPSSGGDSTLPEYGDGIALSLSLGESISYTASDTDSDGALHLPNGEVKHTGDLKPAIAALSDTLGISFSDSTAQSADIFVDTVENLNSRGSYGELINFYTYSDYVENLTGYLARNLDVRTAVSYEGNRKYIYSAPIVYGERVICDLVFIDRATVTSLLDGDGEFVCDTALPYTHTDLSPIMPTSGITAITLVDSDGAPVTVEKNYSAAGNPLVTLRILTELGECDLNSAVNAFRGYIDDAYGGFYSTARSDLFFSEHAAYDADELVALLSLMRAYNGENGEKRDTGRTDSEISAIIFGDATCSDRVAALSAAGFLDGIFIADSDALIPDGLVPILPPFSPRTVISDSTLEEEGSTGDTEDSEPFLPVVAVTYERTVGLRPAFTGYGIAISSSLASNGRKLSAALAVINYLYSSTASDILGFAPDGFFDSENIDATLAHSRSLALNSVAYARRFIGSGILAVDKRLIRAFLSDDASAALDRICLAVEQGNATVKN